MANVRPVANVSSCMDANAPRRGGQVRRPAAVALAIVALVAVVAIASGGGVPGGGVAERRPSEGLLDIAFSLFLVVMAISALTVPIMLSLFGRHEATRPGPKRLGATRSLLTFVLSIVLIAVVVRAVTDGRGDGATPLFPDPERTGTDGALPDRGYRPEFAVWPVVTVGLFAAVALVAWWLVVRGRRSVLPPADATPREALADVLAATLDDLRAERDPRRAVIGAYARMERSLAAAGLARTEAEAPEEYLDRVLAELAVSPAAAGRLTTLFAWARFSRHDVRPEMKDEAIETLVELQDELAAAEAMRELELAGAAR